MSKGKSITLLSILSVIVAFVLVMTFIRFPVGVKNYNSLLGAIDLDYDLAGGTAYTYKLASDNEDEVDDNINTVLDVLEYRLGELGYGAYSVKAIRSTQAGVEDYKIRIETKTTDTLESDMKVVMAHGELKFFGGTSEDNISTEILQDMQVIKSAKYKGEVTTGSYEIDIEFTKQAYDELVKLIEADATYFLKITLGETEEGEENVIFKDQISKDYFTKKRVMPLYSEVASAAKQMALQMQSGGLKYKYEVEDVAKVTSPYGKDVALKCAVAIITLVLVLMIIEVLYYKGFGVIVALSTLLFILGEGWLLIDVPNIVLNMGGVVGICFATVLCGIGMVILAKRVKEEFVNSKKTVKAAVNKGFKQAIVPTININVIAGLFALALFAFTKGVVQCFAITFGIGAVVSLISTLVFTRMYNALIMPLVKNKEKFLSFKREPETAKKEA